MRGVRFDQYESPSFRTILKRLGLWCIALLTLLLACYFIALLADTGELWFAAAALFLMVMCLGASYLLNQEYKEAAASYQMRRDKAAIALFNAAISGDQQKFAVFLRPSIPRIKYTPIKQLSFGSDGAQQRLLFRISLRIVSSKLFVARCQLLHWASRVKRSVLDVYW